MERGELRLLTTMNENFITKLQETFGDLKQLSPEKLKSLVQETLGVFETLQVKLVSKDPAEREEGLRMAMQLKEAFEKQAEKICTSVGMSPSELSAYIENSAHFTPKEWEPVNEIKRELDSFKNEVLGLKESKNPVLRVPVKKTRSQKAWLVG